MVMAGVPRKRTMTYVEKFLLVLFMGFLGLLFAWVMLDDSEVARLVVWLKEKRSKYCKGGSNGDV